MTELLTSAQMRAVEAAAIASGAVTGLELMERAGRGVVEAVFEEWPELGPGPAAKRGGAGGANEYLGQDETQGPRRAVVLCGPGNNGGDGFVVARLLRELGWAVEVFLYGDAAKLPPDARVNYERWCGMGAVGRLADYARQNGWGCDLLVDALFGTGLARALPDLGNLFWNMEDMVDCFAVEPGHSFGRPAIVAIDVPSGLCADSGRVFPHGDTHYRFSATAHLCVTFQVPKRGLYLEDGPMQSGKVVVKDIGLSDHLRERARAAGGRCTLVDGVYPDWIRKSQGDHKYSHGHALILSGPAGRGGAARLAARGALRIGAGVVTVGCPPEAVAEHAARLEAVMLREVADGAALAAVLEDGRINALCLGPGMGLDARAAGVVGVALGRPAGVCSARPPPPTPPHEGEGSHPGPGGTMDDLGLPLPLVGVGACPRREGWGARRGDPRPTDAEGGDAGPLEGAPRRALVLDADALTLIARDAALFGALHEACVLTPHAGEFARLFPDIAARLAEPATTGPAYSKVDATREAAARAGCVVLFKGPDTVIADPTGRCAINSAHYDRAAPWLATAGAGDVLAGFICGLLARGFAPFDAACAGAWLHVGCARSFGPGLIAEDLPEELPKVFRALGL